MNNKNTIAGLIIVIFHLVGTIGTIIPNPFRGLVISLTPLNLLLSSFLLFIASTQKYKLIYFLIITYIIGYFAEWLGVNTGIIFGDYEYGSVLGPKLLGVPLIIGINWFILSYSVGAILNSGRHSSFMKIILGATIMTLIDVLIEQVAISLGYWSWAEGKIPFSNYAGWWIVSFFILWTFSATLKDERNPVSYFLIFSQLIYFIFVIVFL